MADSGDLVEFPLQPEIAQRLADAELGDLPMTTERDGTYCRHRRIRFSPKTRIVHCEDCDSDIDPLLYIERLANDWDWQRRTWHEIRSKIKAAGEHLEDLERRERNAKARVRRAEARSA